MKIGILTLPLKGNYGGVLQAYALLTFLKSKGYDAHLVDRQWDRRDHPTLKYYIQKFIFHYIIRGKIKRFCDKWINPKTFSINSQEKMLTINSEGFDAFIVGSDQVWRIEHIGGVKENYFLDFVQNKSVKKISYAASFGKDSVDGSPEYLNKIAKLMQDFDAISVREESGVEICEKVFGVKAKHVIDPVLLLEKEDYLKILKKEKIITKKNTLTIYVLDTTPEKLKIIERVSKKLNLKINSINYRKNPAKLTQEGLKFDIYNYLYPSLTNWLSGFRDADFVITDSFHGMLFSIIFKKQFFVIGNENRGLARFSSFLKLIKHEERLINYKNLFDISLLDNEINFTEVYKILEQEKVAATSFLNTSIQN